MDNVLFFLNKITEVEKMVNSAVGTKFDKRQMSL
jgi:hypothetical protein